MTILKRINTVSPVKVLSDFVIQLAAKPLRKPSTVWIEYGKVSKRKFRQAYYRATTPIFTAKRQGSLANSESGLVKRQYIAEENSKEVKAAGDAIARRNELERIAKEIRLIEKKLEEE